MSGPTIDLRYSPLYGGARVPTGADKAIHLAGDHPLKALGAAGAAVAGGVLAHNVMKARAAQQTLMGVPIPKLKLPEIHPGDPRVLAASGIAAFGLAGIGAYAASQMSQKQSAYEGYLMAKEAGFMDQVRAAMPHVQDAFNTAEKYIQRGTDAAHGALDSVQHRIDAGRAGLGMIDDVRAKAPILSGHSPKVVARGAKAHGDSAMPMALAGAGVGAAGILGGQHLMHQYQAQQDPYAGLY